MNTISVFRVFFLVLILYPAFSFAQTELVSIQQQWVDTLKSGESVSAFYWQSQSLVYLKIQSSGSEISSETIKSGNIYGIKSYQHRQTFEHDANRYITAGHLDTEMGDQALITGWRNVDGEWKKEIDVLLSLDTTLTQPEASLQQKLDQEREKWVELANQHNPKNHIEQSYTQDTTYFGNGQKSEGHSEIAERYFYMENSNYQVDLEKENLWKISDSNIIEVGRYFTGPEKVGTGGLYLILWELQENQSWQIKLDFNF